jgi:pyruvate/2-oxoglutarate dehydrogenase complex dihydrolipoamide dehydrogenase (E3) component
MSADSFDYDLLVIGSRPAGQRAAIQGAKLDKKVAIVERKTVIGGCSVNLGTIPPKPCARLRSSFAVTARANSTAFPTL